jgi:inner membrane protein
VEDEWTIYDAPLFIPLKSTGCDYIGFQHCCRLIKTKMDTVTQIGLGAAVGEAVLGRQVGSRALLWGGICGLLPDLDVLVPLGDAVRNFTYHRGPSHSLFALAAFTPLMVYWILKVHPQTVLHRTRWMWLVFLAFVTHVLLDCLTVYGTQIFWPLPTPPVMWSTLFIIDPAYSLPLLSGVLAVIIMSRKTTRGHTVNTACLAISTVYLFWSIGAKIHVESVARESLRRQGIGYSALLTTPTAFNTLLWRVVAMDDKGYAEGYYSLLDGDQEIRMMRYPADRHLLETLEGHWPVQRLKWFTHGFYSVKQIGDGIVMTDLRMGMEPDYTFRFRVAAVGNPHLVPEVGRRVKEPRNTNALAWIWHRILTNTAGASPSDLYSGIIIKLGT